MSRANWLTPCCTGCSQGGSWQIVALYITHVDLGPPTPWLRVRVALRADPREADPTGQLSGRPLGLSSLRRASRLARRLRLPRCQRRCRNRRHRRPGASRCGTPGFSRATVCKADGRFYRFFTESLGSGADVMLRIRARIRYRLCDTAERAEPQCSSGHRSPPDQTRTRERGHYPCTSTMRDARPWIGDDHAWLVPQPLQPSPRPLCWRQCQPRRRRPQPSRQRRPTSIALWVSRPRWVTPSQRPS